MPKSKSSLQEEIRQGKPFRSLGQEAALALFRTADVIRRRFSSEVERHGVTLQQYNVLRILRGSPDGLNTLAIADRMVERAPGITRMIDRLERKGWVTRTRGTADRRCVSVRITQPGLELLAGLDDVVNQVDADAVQKLSSAEAEQLIGLLERMRGVR